MLDKQLGETPYLVGKDFTLADVCYMPYFEYAMNTPAKDIIAKYPHPRWNHFLLIDYPSASDRHRHELAKVTGEVASDASIGGNVGIHGTDKPDKNRRGVDWTWGCVSVDNEAIDELNRLLPLGTPVVIEN